MEWKPTEKSMKGRHRKRRKVDVEHDLIQMGVKKWKRIVDGRPNGTCLC